MDRRDDEDDPLAALAGQSGADMVFTPAEAGIEDTGEPDMVFTEDETGEPDHLAALAPEQPGTPDPRQAAARYEGPDGLYGHDSAVGDPRTGLERLRAMIAQRAPQTRSNSHEDAYRASAEPPDHAALKQAMILSGLLGDNDMGQIAQIYEGRRGKYESGLAEARARDDASGPVDQATAEQLVMMGVSPEAAAGMTRDSAALQLAKSMPYLARGYRQDDLRNDQHATGELGKDVRNEQDNAVKLATAKIGADAKKKKAGGGGGGVPAVAPAEWLSAQTNVPLDIAQAFSAGQLEGIEPQQAEALKVASGIFAKLDGKTRQQTFKSLLGHESNAPDALQSKRNDPVQRTKMRTELARSFRGIQAASAGWAGLSPAERNAAVKLGMGSSMQELALSPAAQVNVSRVVGVMNDFIREMSGAAVSNSEMGRIASAVGMAPGFTPWKSPAVVANFLKQLQQAYADRHRIVSEEFGGQL
jgi:hypothetical protein